MMRGKSILAVGVTAVAVAGIAVGLAALGTSGRHSDGVTLLAASGTTVVDPTVGETFRSDASAAKSRTNLLSPDTAFRRFAGKAGALSPSSGVQLGYLTLPLGAGAPGQYTAHNQLVYAYTSDSCGPRTGTVPRPGSTPVEVSPSDTADCKQWLFVDAVTGKMVDLTWTR